MPAKKKGTKRGNSNSRGKAKVGKVMHEYKHGELKSGGKRPVRNPKQAIAIALSEARRSGASVPPKKKATKKSSASKTAGRKTAGKRAPTKKAGSSKRAGAKRSSGRKRS